MHHRRDGGGAVLIQVLLLLFLLLFGEYYLFAAKVTFSFFRDAGLLRGFTPADSTLWHPDSPPFGCPWLS